MEMILNTANPIMIIVYTLITASIILTSRKLENVSILIVLIVIVISLLVYHSMSLDGLKNIDGEGVSQIYYCIAVDLVMLLLTFISYLWIDDIVAKKKKMKSYDDSLNWFWNKI